MKEIGIIILAGGKSSRMGQDKGLMMFKNKAMISHVIERVWTISNDIMIISNNVAYEKFGLKVHPDIHKEIGTLGGIFTGLSRSETEYNMILSCDTPFITSELLQLLISKADNYDVCIPTYNQRSHQLIGIYTKNCMAIFEKKIKEKDFKIRNSFNLLNVNLVDCNHMNENNFTNINTVEDLNAY